MKITWSSNFSGPKGKFCCNRPSLVSILAAVASKLQGQNWVAAEDHIDQRGYSIYYWCIIEKQIVSSELDGQISSTTPFNKYQFGLTILFLLTREKTKKRIVEQLGQHDMLLCHSAVIFTELNMSRVNWRWFGRVS